MRRSEHQADVRGAGLGLRRALLGPFAQASGARDEVDFLEVAPENWMHLGGSSGRAFREWTEAKPFVCHGLSLDIGGPRPLDHGFLQDLRRFLEIHGIRDYTEHPSACGDELGHLYDLMPIPFTEDAVRHVADRVRRVQDILGMRIALENVSYYAQLGAEMSEAAFLCAVLEAADCDLLLDVNNVFVNSINHGYSPTRCLDQLPLHRVRYLHIAGHHEEAPDLRVDTHGAPVCPDVWALLDEVYERLGPVPTVLERDFNFPPLQDLLEETRRIRQIRRRHAPPDHGLRSHA
jgi:uncharacterized protein